MFRRLLLWDDGSEQSRQAFKRGAELALLAGAQVVFRSVVERSALSPVTVAAAVGHSYFGSDAHDDRAILEAPWLDYKRSASAQRVIWSMAIG